MELDYNKTFIHNFIVNVLDGAFFGFALGFASFVTLLPLFVSTMTNSAILIGLIPAVHTVGWQFPQLLIANHVSKQKKFLPLVLWLTIHERLPFLGLALTAWFLPIIGVKIGLIFTFIMLIWQGLGGGFTASAWQAMISKIIPGERRGTFLGTQASASSLLGALGAVLSGLTLERFTHPINFSLCFIFACIPMVFSFIFVAQTREKESIPIEPKNQQHVFRHKLRDILRNDMNFRWFLIIRMLSQVATMGFAFYTVYAVRNYGMNVGLAGLMTGILMATQIVANPIMGWIGDRLGHRIVMGAGVLAASISTVLASFATHISWFYIIYILAGIANVALWTISMTMTLEFGSESDRPAYIGLANTLISPIAILAPLLGGWLADNTGYPITFRISAVAGLLTVLVLLIKLRNTRRVVEDYSWQIASK